MVPKKPLAFRLKCFVDGKSVEEIHVFGASNVEMQMIKGGSHSTWRGSGDELIQCLLDLCEDWEESNE